MTSAHVDVMGVRSEEPGDVEKYASEEDIRKNLRTLYRAQVLRRRTPRSRSGSSSREVN